MGSQRPPIGSKQQYCAFIWDQNWYNPQVGPRLILPSGAAWYSMHVTKDKPNFLLQSLALLLSGLKSCVRIFHIIHIQYSK